MRKLPNIPYWLRALGNVCVIVWLLSFSVVVGNAFRADWQLRRSEIRALSLPSVKEKDRTQAFASMHREMTRLAEDLLPTIRFHLESKHAYAHFYSGYALYARNRKAAKIFAESALEIHPKDGHLMQFLAKRAFEEGRKQTGVAYMERYLEAFGPNPNSDLCHGLVDIYRLQDRQEEADKLAEELNARVLGVPAGPCPENRTAGVSLDVTFDWSDCNTEAYDLFLWKTGEQTPELPVAENLKVSEYQPKEPLLPNTVYFWRVVAHGRYGEEPSELWFFRTAKE